MANPKKEFVIRPEDTAFSVLRAVVALVKQMLANGVRVSVVISKWVPPKTPPQHRTVFMWCSEVANQLNAMGALIGTSDNWKTEDVYELIFKRVCMPQKEMISPDGEIYYRATGLSDKEATLDTVSGAMTKFQIWAIERGIELTQPE